tara:strand:- start:25 stop:1131 length:1107 start_codon:yes stop_codon:yes gene_type:complete
MSQFPTPPTAPSLADPANFDTRSDAFLAWMTDIATQWNTTEPYISGDSPSFANVVATGYVQVNGQVLASNGTAALPPYSFENDPDSGMFWATTNQIGIATNGLERGRIAGANWVWGKTAVDISVAGSVSYSNGQITATSDGRSPIEINRLGTSGNFINLLQDGTQRGVIGSDGADLYIDSDSTGAGVEFVGGAWLPRKAGAKADDAVNLGSGSYRFDNIYATNGTINTSDENEKQEIATLSPELMKVAARVSKEFISFKWNSAVKEKGDQARIHWGTIAQRVEEAFHAEGVNPWEYGLLTLSFWMEHTDAEGVETRYDGQSDPSTIPDDAVMRVRLGVRYTELLSFVAAYNEQRFTSLEERLAVIEAK